VGANVSSRFAMYIDGVKVLDSEDFYGKALLPEDYADNVRMRGKAAGDRLFLLYVSTIERVSSLDLSSTWYADHRLRFGSDALSGSSSQPWAGGVELFAMYNRPLSASNFGAGVDNSYPVAHDLVQVVDEDNCKRHADLANAATDWDNEGLGRQQTLTASLDGLPSTGTLHADSRCSDAPLDQASAANLLLRDPALGHDVYFLPPPNEYSIGGSHRAPNVTLPWSIDDGEGGTSAATLTIALRAVNDPPHALPSTLEAYMTVRTMLTVGGTDVDGPHPASPVSDCGVQVTRPPMRGTLGSTRCRVSLSPVWASLATPPSSPTSRSSTCQSTCPGRARRRASGWWRAILSSSSSSTRTAPRRPIAPR